MSPTPKCHSGGVVGSSLDCPSLGSMNCKKSLISACQLYASSTKGLNITALPFTRGSIKHLEPDGMMSYVMMLSHCVAMAAWQYHIASVLKIAADMHLAVQIVRLAENAYPSPPAFVVLIFLELPQQREDLLVPVRAPTPYQSLRRLSNIHLSRAARDGHRHLALYPNQPLRHLRLVFC